MEECEQVPRCINLNLSMFFFLLIGIIIVFDEILEVRKDWVRTVK